MAKSKQEDVSQTKQYVKFLEKALASKNFKNRASEEEYEKTKEKLKKAKGKLKLLGVKL